MPGEKMKIFLTPARDAMLRRNIVHSNRFRVSGAAPNGLLGQAVAALLPETPGTEGAISRMSCRRRCWSSGLPTIR